ncbi:MAG: L-seryl-tRNA(Sec) selenium transferase [Phycisphaerae bacterium]|nr:L-seryl-tRNA(Sec) selenium transferase [Phycisphaerae bacterium]
MSPANPAVLRCIPSVDRLLTDERLLQCGQDVPRKILVDAVRQAVDEVRNRLMAGGDGDVEEDVLREEILALAEDRIRSASGPHYRRVINATGIILHTALGRAVLPAKALDQIRDELSGYSLLQADVEAGKRSKRDGRIEWLLQQLTGAEAATVVNNNAAATSIVLNTLAKGREVIVSRGQLVEIGGSFRLPEVMEASGVRLVEVGTTNKTHPRDYENAITQETAALMRCHPSNYRVTGFTSEVPLEEMVRIAHEHDLPMIDDVGAGALIDYSQFGFEKEPMLAESIAAGADVVTASADKLIGAHQGGIILGKAHWIEAIRKNPLARIVRVGKLTLAPLEATLTLFLDEELACREVPTLRMLRRDHAEIVAQAERIASAIGEGTSRADVEPIDGHSKMGSGSLPEQNLPTRLVAVRPHAVGAEEVSRALRRRRPAVFARIQKDRILVDPRTLLSGEEQELIEAFVAVLNADAGKRGCR